MYHLKQRVTIDYPRDVTIIVVVYGSAASALEAALNELHGVMNNEVALLQANVTIEDVSEEEQYATH